MTIDELTKQIVTRYKAIFSNDPSYREPNKVILKSSDDLILFGQDLIKDVLSNLCQVKQTSYHITKKGIIDLKNKIIKGTISS